MKIKQKFATDREAENNGTWIPIGDGAELLIARANNPKHKQARARLGKQLRPYTLSGTEPPEELDDQINIRALAEGVLLDWKGIEDDDGSPIPYSVDNAIELMTEMRDFRDLVAFHATEIENFRGKEAEDIAGNSSGGSTGSEAQPPLDLAPSLQDSAKEAKSSPKTSATSPSS